MRSASTTEERRPPAPPTAPADTRRRVVLIEDEADIAEAMAYQLEKAGLQVKVARTGEEGLEVCRRGVDLVLLDLNLPDMDGLEVCRLIRRQAATAQIPIIIVSARADEVDRVLGLEMGADDYVVKPFSLKELAARAKVALRRADVPGQAAQAYRDENFEVEYDSYLVRYKGEEIRLTPKEFELLWLLASSAGRVLTHHALLKAIWGVNAIHQPEHLRVLVGALRRKIEPDPSSPRYILTEPWVGYRFADS
jgi:two-component system KDP operon response regulator KdpE